MLLLPTLILSALGAFASTSSAGPALQDPAESREGSEMERFLRNDPQVRLAEANLEKARAELIAARYDATLRILELRHKMNELQQRRDVLAESYARVRQLVEVGSTSSHDLSAVQLELVQVEGAMQATQLRLHQMEQAPSETVGRVVDDFTKHATALASVARPAPSPETKAALDREVVLEIPPMPGKTENFPVKPKEMLLKDWVQQLAERGAIRLIVSQEVEDTVGSRMLYSLPITGTEIKVGEAMGLMADVWGVAFLQREYGWILLPVARARELAGCAIPPDLPCTNAAAQPGKGGVGR